MYVRVWGGLLHLYTCVQVYRCTGEQEVEVAALDKGPRGQRCEHTTLIPQPRGGT